MKVISILSLVALAPIVLAMPTELVSDLEKRVGNCGNKCPENKKAIVSMSYSDIHGNEYGPTVGILDRGIDTTIDSKRESTDDVCGKYEDGFIVNCDGETVKSLYVPSSGNTWKCEVKKESCSATTGVSTTYYQTHACC
ncbi:hypothetical protein ACLOAV_010044 [Pseudogymnoascus australis]